MRTIPFLVYIILVYYVIRISLREAQQKEKMADLNSHLEQKVAEQTKEIRHAYELEKHARRELEKLNETKDQFIMITQHHLRTPVTSIRWELENIMGGKYGTFNDGLQKALTDTNTAVGRLIKIVDDFLSITTLKVGGQILTIDQASLLPLIKDILHELDINIGDMGVTISYPEDESDWPHIPVDVSKIREVILVVIENAVRYNKKGGTISIEPRIQDETFELVVKNTGVGLSAEDRQKMFGQLFYRGKDARQAHPIGMGIGLSVARAIVRAHHGELDIRSDGPGTGATVTIKLPLSRHS
ncbi:MAG: HAMP domain-containing histidine kinase [Patescibacteria group bacterium]|nr:HAMP domain-containing histidine kinase [Patescibacteria group bacterium]